MDCHIALFAVVVGIGLAACSSGSSSDPASSEFGGTGSGATGSGGMGASGAGGTAAGGGGTDGAGTGGGGTGGIGTGGSAAGGTGAGGSGTGGSGTGGAGTGGIGSGGIGSGGSSGLGGTAGTSGGSAGVGGAAGTGGGGSVDPGTEGPYEVVVEDAMAGDVAVTVFTPVGQGPFPLLLISPGFQMDRAQYATQARFVASHGFVAVTQNFAGGVVGGPTHAELADQTAAVIAWAAPRAAPAPVGVAGHSLGGKISFLTAATHEEAGIGVVIGWDPVDANDPSVAPELMGDVDVPVVVLGETQDGSGGSMPCAPSADNYQQYYAAAGSPAVEITVLGADHMDWVDDTGCAFCGFCTAGTADDTEVKALTRRTTVATLRRYLLGDTAMDAYLTGAVIQSDLRASVQSK